MKSFDMLKKAGAMRKQMKQLQKDLAKQTAEGSSGGVSVVARGDMTIREIKIDPEQVDVTKTELLQKQIVSAVNSALGTAQKQAASAMAGATGGLGGLSDLLG